MFCPSFTPIDKYSIRTFSLRDFVEINQWKGGESNGKTLHVDRSIDFVSSMVIKHQNVREKIEL